MKICFSRGSNRANCTAPIFDIRSLGIGNFILVSRPGIGKEEGQGGAGQGKQWVVRRASDIMEHRLAKTVSRALDDADKPNRRPLYGIAPSLRLKYGCLIVHGGEAHWVTRGVTQQVAINHSLANLSITDPRPSVQRLRQ